MARIRALALDFGDTLARPGPEPDGVTVARILHGLDGTVVPEAFPSAFELVGRRIREEDRAHFTQSAFADLLRRSAQECGAVIPDPTAATEAVFTAVPDAEVDPRAADALRRLHERGLACVLACDTRRPEIVRRRTLEAAGIADCFDALVLSSTLGVRKPNPLFYDAVVSAAGCRPENILFVGDVPAKDAIGPYRFGMRAVLVTSSPRPDDLPESIGVIGHFAELPGYLEHAGEL
ncbi:HAD family hydrolase [Streptomyces kaniharaensis]|uniref:HAD family hydrolase n=1 Tax=Streptomyces kaniharaensis TaxID=212423 RepID=A0A6N7KYV9_9ACTN|nr:HAD family hydrolase [Streptomyces kaniharaensis]MQS15749.1 HAD family hydrolase [Streptomyces kaniharaensis]